MKRIGLDIIIERSVKKHSKQILQDLNKNSKNKRRKEWKSKIQPGRK